MEVRYLGFDQERDRRVYRFDVSAKGEQRRQLEVTADIALFQTHRVAIQDGPSLCARKLASDLETHIEGAHTLTTEDFRLHAEARVAAETKKAEMRQSASRRPKPEVSRDSLWRRGPV
jgi:hypothetical protein